MIKTNYLQDIFTEEKQFKSIDAKISNFRKKIIDNYKLQNITQLNEIKSDSFYKSLALQFLEESSKKNDYFSYCNVSYDEFINSVAARIEFLLLRGIYTNTTKKDKNSFTYSLFNDEYVKIYTPIYDLEESFEKGIFNISTNKEINKNESSKKELSVAKIEKEIKKALTKNDLSIKDIDDIEKLENIAPLIAKFKKSHYKILILTIPTGKGKSTGIRRYIGSQYVDGRTVNKIIYLIDVNANLKNEFNDLQEELKDFNVKALIIFSNSNSILENKVAFENLPEIFTETYEYELLLNLINEKNFNKNEDYYKDKLNNYELKFRTKCKEIINNTSGYETCKTVEQKYNFIKNHDDLKFIIDVYTNMKMYETNEWFINMHKFLSDIDTLIETISLKDSKKYLENSVLFFDESDELKNTMTDIICEKSITSFDLYVQIDIIINNLTNSTILYQNNEYLENFFNEILSIRESIKLPNYDIEFDSDLKNRPWLFSLPGNSTLVNGDDYYLVNSRSNDKTILQHKSKVEKESKIIMPYGDFVKILSDLYIKILKFLSKITLEFQKRIDPITGNKYTQMEAVENIISRYANIKRDTEEERKMKEDILNNISSTSLSYNEDPYLNPISSINTTTKNNVICAQIRNYLISTTPEKILYDLCQIDNINIVLSSATAANRSIVSNFNLNWDKLVPYIYVQSEKEKKLELEYIQRLDKYSDKVNISVNRANKDVNKNKEYLMKNNLLDEITIDTFVNKLTKLDSNINRQKYKINEILAFLVDVHKKIKKGSRANLAVFSSKISLKDSTFKELFDKFIENCQENESIELIFISASADNSDEKIKEFHELLSDQVTHNNRFVFLIAPYKSFGKALNLQFNTLINASEIVAINDYAQKKLLENIKDGTVQITIDLSGIYLGNIYHLLPSINSNKGFNEKIKSILEILMVASSLKAAGEIDEDEYEKVLKKIAKEENYPISSKDIGISKVAKIIKIIQQAIGRMLRTGYKYLNMDITIDEELLSPLKGYNVDHFYDEFEYEKQTYIMKKVIENILDEEVSDYLNDIPVPERIKNSIKTHSILTKEIHSSKGNKKKKKKAVQKYNNWHSSVKAYTISEEEFNKKSQEEQDLYFKKPSSYSKEKGYSYKYKESFGEKEIIAIGDYRKYPNKINNDFGLNENIINILIKEGHSFDDSGEYIITPKGEELFKGNIGETLSKIYFSDMLDYIEELPIDINETTDFMGTLSKTHVFIDAKLYVEQDEQYDDFDKNKKKYLYKLDVCSDYIKQKIALVEINARPCNEEMKIQIENCKNGKIIRVPNIYKNGEFDIDIKHKILDHIRELK